MIKLYNRRPAPVSPRLQGLTVQLALMVCTNLCCDSDGNKLITVLIQHKVTELLSKKEQAKGADTGFWKGVRQKLNELSAKKALGKNCASEAWIKYVLLIHCLCRIMTCRLDGRKKSLLKTMRSMARVMKALACL